MNNRDTYIDIAKGLCMMLIICIHTEVFGVIRMPLTFIAVPMFFFMSGLYDRSEKKITNWLPKSLRTLILPGIIWILIGVGYSILLQFIKTKEIPSISFDIYNPATGNGPAWFLFALIITKIVTWAQLKLRMSKIALILSSIIIGYIGYKCQLPFFIDEGLVAVPLYAIGKCIYPYLNKISSNILITALSLSIIVIYICGFVSYGIVPVGNGSYYEPYYIIALSAILLCFPAILYISKKIENISYLNFLAIYGQKSLGIMLLHAPMCHTAAVILNRIFEVGSNIWIASFIIAYFLIVVISYYLTCIIEKYCPILLGKTRTITTNG